MTKSRDILGVNRSGLALYFSTSIMSKTVKNLIFRFIKEMTVLSKLLPNYQ